MHADYNLANGEDVTPPFSASEKADLYAEMASGAESGWDYTARFFRDSSGRDGLRSLDIRNTIPICLNSIMCAFVVSKCWRKLMASLVQIRRIFSSENCMRPARVFPARVSTKARFIEERPLSSEKRFLISSGILKD